MSDNKLIKACQSGDKPAFEKLLNEHYDTIYRFAYRWCGDQVNAQDITQQACIKLAKSIKQFNFQSSFNSWLYRLVINCAKDFYKSPNMHNKREEQSDELENHQSPFNDQYEQQLYSQQILEHINTLQDDLKDTLILVFGKGLTHLQAAKQLDIKESTVSWRIHEARKLLKQTFHSSSFKTDIPTSNTNNVRGSA